MSGAHSRIGRILPRFPAGSSAASAISSARPASVGYRRSTTLATIPGPHMSTRSARVSVSVVKRNPSRWTYRNALRRCALAPRTPRLVRATYTSRSRGTAFRRPHAWAAMSSANTASGARAAMRCMRSWSMVTFSRYTPRRNRVSQPLSTARRRSRSDINRSTSARVSVGSVASVSPVVPGGPVESSGSVASDREPAGWIPEFSPDSPMTGSVARAGGFRSARIPPEFDKCSLTPGERRHNPRTRNREAAFVVYGVGRSGGKRGRRAGAAGVAGRGREPTQ